MNEKDFYCINHQKLFSSELYFTSYRWAGVTTAGTERAGFHHHPSSWGCEPEIWLQSAHRHNSKRNDRTIGRFFCSSLRSKTHCHTTKTDPAVIQNTTEGKDPTHKIQSPPWSQTFLHINQKHCFTNHEIHVLIRSAPDWTWSISTFQSSTRASAVWYCKCRCRVDKEPVLLIPILLTHERRWCTREQCAMIYEIYLH